MKVDYQTKPTFSPVSIIMTFETPKELDVFSCLCNLCPLTEVVTKHGGALPNTEGLRKLGADLSQTIAILDDIIKTPAVQFRINSTK